MYNRQPTPGQEGRMRIIPENGEPAFFAKVEMADNPLHEGTPLTVETLLKHTTGALYGLPESAVPDDVLRVLSRFQTGLGNEYVWRKIKYSEVLEEYASTGTYRIVTISSNGSPKYSDEIRLLNDGTIEMVNPVSVTGEWVIANYASLAGKYFFNNSSGSAATRNILFKFGDSVGWSPASDSSYLNVTYGLYGVSATANTVGYVNSPDANAYPPAADDGFGYDSLGQMGAKATIKTGSYVGTGSYGVNGKTTINFSVKPKIVFVYRDAMAFFILPGQTMASTLMGGNTYTGIIKVAWAESSVSWYSENNAANQLNYIGYTYDHVSII